MKSEVLLEKEWGGKMIDFRIRYADDNISWMNKKTHTNRFYRPKINGDDFGAQIDSPPIFRYFCLFHTPKIKKKIDAFRSLAQANVIYGKCKQISTKSTYRFLEGAHQIANFYSLMPIGFSFIGWINKRYPIEVCSMATKVLSRKKRGRSIKLMKS